MINVLANGWRGPDIQGIAITGIVGNMIFGYNGNRDPFHNKSFKKRPDEAGFNNALLANWR
jgi:hypothetical protein